MRIVYEQQKIAKMIERERTALSLSKDKLATYLNVNRNTITAWERTDKKGRIPPLDDLLHMCELFDCEIEYLLGRYECKTRTATDIQEVSGLSAYTIKCLLDYNEIPHNLDFDLLDFIEYLIQSKELQIPMRINTLLKLSKDKASVKKSDREEQIFAEIYHDIKVLVSKIHEDIEMREGRKKMERITRNRVKRVDI